MGEGKGWAKGRTAATDPRVARAAAGHRGKTYRRHLAPELDRRTWSRTKGYEGVPVLRTLPLEWSATMAYVVGLMATDGCLTTSKHLSFDTEDEQLVRTFLGCLGRPPVYRALPTKDGGIRFKAQFGDIEFYRWLLGIGLSPRKSLVLGPIAMPDDIGLLCHVSRGLIDGDGSVLNFWYSGTGKARGRRYESLVTRFSTASRAHMEWLRERLSHAFGITGGVSTATTSAGNTMYQLSYAIRESCVLLPHIYASDAVPRLDRKWIIWRAYAERHGYPPTLEERTLRGFPDRTSVS